MSEHASTLPPPVMPGLFRTRADGSPALLGGHCGGCNRYSFPASVFCPYCPGSVTEVELGAGGRLYSHTTIRTRPPYGLPRPYSTGWVDLDAVRLRIFALLDPALAGQFAIGEALVLATAAIGVDGSGRSVVRPYFTRGAGR